MKKTLIFAVALTLLITGSCWATAIVRTADYISFPVVALDSVTGVECVPESVHIHVWYGSLTNTTVYSNREVGDGADLAQIDSVATGYAGAVPQQYYFHDQVQDIDGAGTYGVYTINVRLWRGTTPTSNWFSFQIVGNALSNVLLAVETSLDDSLGDAKNKAILTNAEVANIDAWNPATTEVLADIRKVGADAITDNGDGRLEVNVEEIGDDATAAVNLEKAFDGDTTWGTNSGLSLTTMFVRPEAGNTDAVFLEGLGTGDGINTTGSVGVYAEGTGSGTNYGIYAIGADVGIHGRGSGGSGILGIGTTAGMELQGTSTDDLVLGNTGHIRGWMDSVLYIESVSTQVTAIQAYLGAGDSWRQHLLPFGEANKDSIRTFNAGTCNSTVYIWKDASDVSIPDSILQVIW